MSRNFQIFKKIIAGSTNITLDDLESESILSIGDVVSINENGYLEAGYSGDMTFVPNTDFTTNDSAVIDTIMLSDTFGVLGFYDGIASTSSIVGFNVSTSGVLTWTESQTFANSSSTTCISLCKIDSTTCALFFLISGTARVIVFEFNSNTNKFAPSASQGATGLVVFSGGTLENIYGCKIVTMSTNNFLLTFCKTNKLSTAHLEWNGTDIAFSGSDPAVVDTTLTINIKLDLVSVSSSLAVCVVSSYIFSIQISPITVQTAIEYNSSVTTDFAVNVAQIYIDSVLQSDKVFVSCMYRRATSGVVYAIFGCIATITSNEVDAIIISDWRDLTYSGNDIIYNIPYLQYSTGLKNGLVAITYYNYEIGIGSGITLVDVTGSTPTISQNLLTGLTGKVGKLIDYSSGADNYAIYISESTSSYSGIEDNSAGIGAVCKFFDKSLSPGLKNSCITGIIDFNGVLPTIYRYNVITCGIANLSNLLPGCIYYATEDGELTTSELSTRRNAYGKVGSNRLIGIALSSTQLVVNVVNVFPTQI